MKKSFFIVLLCLFVITGYTQQIATYNQRGYSLTFINFDGKLDSALQKRMVTTFFDVYPKLAKEHNRQTLKQVTMVIDTTYKGVAETDNGKVTISSAWMHKHPEDIDVITHEVMHILQDYGESAGPGWLTEGIADYARYQFGVNNEAANWKLPDYKAGQHYTNSYRITARFLLWIEKKIKAGTVKKLNEQLRLHTFTNNSWKMVTGKTLDELWNAYIANSVIS